MNQRQLKRLIRETIEEQMLYESNSEINNAIEAIEKAIDAVAEIDDEVKKLFPPRFIRKTIANLRDAQKHLRKGIE